MPTVQEFVAIAAPATLYFTSSATNRSAAASCRTAGAFRTLTQRSDRVGSQMEIEWQVGPSPLRQVIEALEISESQVIEAPPGGDNYLTTWTVGEDATATLVGVHMRFEYGDILGEFFVKRRLRRAFGQMLRRLREIAEAEGRLD